MALFISQSGETADTLASLRYCALNGQPTAALVNVSESSIAQEAEVFWPLSVGPEIGVASTKAFTGQLAVLACLALAAAPERGQPPAGEDAPLVQVLAALPPRLSEALQLDTETDS